MDSIGDVVSFADEVHGFRYFDDRDVIEFVDGTVSPRGSPAHEAAIERIIGRKKLSDIELKDAEKPPYALNVVTVIEKNGKERKILRDNMPFGRPDHGEFGSYFIGYSRTPRITETMLQNLFVGRPSRQLRPPARLQQTRYGKFSFCTVVNISRQPESQFLELEC